MAATKVEELGRQLELLKSGKMEGFNDNQSSVVELDRLYKELQVSIIVLKEQICLRFILYSSSFSLLDS